MIEWDYRVICGHMEDGEESEMLHQMGTLGWELVQVLDASGGANRYFFKRPRAIRR